MWTFCLPEATSAKYLDALALRTMAKTVVSDLAAYMDFSSGTAFRSRKD